jgi:hypothetical protein
MNTADCSSPDAVRSTNARAIAEGGRMMSGFHPGAKNSQMSRNTATDPSRTIQSFARSRTARRR